MLKTTLISTAIFAALITILQRAMNGEWPALASIMASSVFYFLLMLGWNAYAQRKKEERAKAAGGIAEKD